MSEADTHFVSGAQHLLTGRHAEAMAEFSRAIDLDPSHLKAYRNRAFAYRALGELALSRADYDAAVAVDPIDPDLRADRAFVCYLQGDYPAALDGCDRSIDLRPTPNAVHTRARVHAERGDHDLARADYDAATLLEEENAAAFVRQTESTLERLEQLQSARAAAMAALKCDHLTQEQHAEAALRVQESAEFLAAATAARGPVPSAASARAKRLLTLNALADWPGIVATAGDLLDADPGHAPALKFRSYARHFLGDTARSLADADELVRVAPDAEHYRFRGWLRAAHGLAAGALADYEAALPADLGSFAIRNGIAGLLATTSDDAVRDGARAVALAEAVVKEDGATTHHYLDTLASAYAEVGRFDDAAARQEQANALLPEGEDRQPFESRLALYRQGRPYRTASG